ncbi:MAG: hypothetical protein ABGX25_06705 [Nautiliaceae bacterium]
MNILEKTILILILLTQINAKEVFISFSFVSYNNKLVYNNFNCSFALTSSEENGVFLFSLPCNSDDIIKFCYKNSSLIIENLLKKNVFFYSNEKLDNNFYFGRSKITFTPKRFDIIIKDNWAYFYLKEEH